MASKLPTQEHRHETSYETRHGRGAGTVSYTHLDVYKRQLKDVLKALSDSNFKYKTIHCSFCLAVQNEKGEMVWDAKNQTFVKKK